MNSKLFCLANLKQASNSSFLSDINNPQMNSLTDESIISERSVVDLGNYVVLRICRLLWNKVEEIRSIIGMCGEFYRLKDHVYFVNGRPIDVFTSFRVGLMKNMMFNTTPTGVSCLLMSEGFYPQTVFLDKQITKDVFRWNIHFRYRPRYFSISIFRIGVVPSCGVSDSFESMIGDVEGTGTCGFGFCKVPRPMFAVSGASRSVDLLDSLKYGVSEESLVSIEVDANTRRLFFFADGKKTPYAVSGIHTPLYVGISGLSYQSFTSVSFCRIPTITPSSVVCRLYECNAMGEIGKVVKKVRK